MPVLASVPRRKRMISVRDLVQGIGLSGVPAKVLQTVVQSVTVVVATFLPWRARTDERKKHQSMLADLASADAVLPVVMLVDMAREYPFTKPAPQFVGSLKPLNLPRSVRLVAGKTWYVCPRHSVNNTRHMVSA